MFFKEPKLPNDLILLILNQLSLKDAIRVARVSSSLRVPVKSTKFWKEFGAENFQDFMTRISKLDQRLKHFIIYQQCTLPTAEKIQEIWKLPTETNRLRFIIISPGQLSRIESDPHMRWRALGNDFGIIALCLRLITPEQAMRIRENALGYLMSLNGLKALLEGLITPEQAAAFNKSNEYELHNLLEDAGIHAMREGLITAEQVTRMKKHSLQFLLSEEGILALREGLITSEQVTQFKSYDLLPALLYHNNGVVVLREKLITSVQVAQFGDPAALRYLLEDKGLIALREKLITPEKAASCSSLELIDYVDKQLEKRAKQKQYQDTLLASSLDLSNLERGILFDQAFNPKEWITSFFGSVNIPIYDEERKEIGKARITKTMNIVLKAIDSAKQRAREYPDKKNEIYSEALAQSYDHFKAALNSSSDPAVTQFYKNQLERLEKYKTIEVKPAFKP